MSTSHVNPEIEVQRILREHKAMLVRTKKHLVWKFPDGRIFTQASTPSDFRASANQLRDLKYMLGLISNGGAAGERRPRKNNPGREQCARITPSANPAMLEALRKVGLTEEALNAKIATLTIELRAARRANHRKKRQLRQISAHCKRCWGCAMRRWWKRLMGRMVA